MLIDNNKVCFISGFYVLWTNDAFMCLHFDDSYSGETNLSSSQVLGMTFYNKSMNQQVSNEIKVTLHTLVKEV